MQENQLARIAGIALLGTIIVSIPASLLVSQGIDINQTGDFGQTASAMLEAGSRLHARAWLAMLVFVLGTMVCAGFFLLLRRNGELLAWVSLILSITASAIGLLGAIATLNTAQIAGQSDILSADQQVLLSTMQVNWDYTSFHFALVVSSLANAGFFALFLKSKLLPRPLSAFGLFASLFVAAAVVGRDFIASLGSDGVTIAFLVSNMLALVATGLWLAVRGARAEVADQ